MSIKFIEIIKHLIKENPKTMICVRKVVGEKNFKQFIRQHKNKCFKNYEELFNFVQLILTENEVYKSYETHIDRMFKEGWTKIEKKKKIQKSKN